MEEGFDMEEGREDPRHVTGTTVRDTQLGRSLHQSTEVSLIPSSNFCYGNERSFTAGVSASFRCEASSQDFGAQNVLHTRSSPTSSWHPRLGHLVLATVWNMAPTIWNKLHGGVSSTLSNQIGAC